MKKITISLCLMLYSLGYSQQPAAPADSPTLPQSDVISMFSNAYSNVPVDTWQTSWSAATVEDVQIAGNDVKKYTGLSFVGIETVANQLDITSMTYFNIDVWSPDFPLFKVKLVDFGADAAFGGGDDREHEITFNAPAQSQWVHLHIPLSEFENLTTRQHIAQLILVGGSATVFVDNVYFSNEVTIPVVTDPVTAAPDPTTPASDVMSLFSNVYTNVAVDTWRTSWSDATLADVQVAGNDVKKYTGLNFVGIETVAQQLDITGMTHFNVDVWSPNFTVFKVKLVDFGADAAFGGGDDTEHEITFNSPALSQWVTLHIPLTDFTNLMGRQHIAQLIFVGGGGKVYVDNVYFSNETTVPPVTDPLTAAPNPVLPQTDVMSLFSNVYTNVPVDTWHTSWSSAALEDVQVAGNDTKKYTSLVFVGVETVAQELDITGMSHFNVDVWSPDFTVFKVKLVDFGNDGAFGGGDDTEHEITFDNPSQGQWVTLHIPLSDFANLMGRQHIAQLIFASSNAKVYVDNVYFSDEVVTPPVTDPLTAAPDPVLPQTDVMSLFSNVYTDVPVDTWQTSWSAATLEDVQIAGNDTKKYTGLSFVGVETVANQLNITDMTVFNVDVWSPDFTVFKVKLVDFGADAAFGGGDDKEHEITFNAPAQGQWVSLHIPLTEFENLTTREHIAQLIFASSGAKVYVDNVYFSNEPIIVIPTDPMVAAPDPTLPEAQVMSMFSNAYTNVAVDTWRTSWSDATLADVQVDGNDTKKYTGLNFVGVETVAQQLDITGMTHFNVDVWSPNFSVFKVKLVDFGADAAFGGGDDTEHEITFNGLTLSDWNTIQIPLSDFTNLMGRQHIAQLIFASNGAKVYVDNVYFSTDQLGVGENESVKMTMYPNPATTSVQLSAQQNIDNVVIFNAIGQKVISLTPAAMNISVDVSRLHAGIYFVNATSQGKTASQKLIIK
ncbi:T9SS type A sorting domain-containing protein [Flavobacterium pallidum]|nr:T9SS type A sorting domain-containing protein [Flavobacterium pallidum]